MRTWYRVIAKADNEETREILIYDEIGPSFWNEDAVRAKQFVDELAALPDTVRNIRVRVNCPGGDVFEAVAIANALKEQRSRGRSVETIIDGLAASAASIVIMAGDVITIADNALVFVHNPCSIVAGNAEAMRKAGDDLDSIRTAIVATYQWHSKLTEKELIALLDAETWMDADEAVANGFATRKVEGPKAAARLTPSASAKLRVPDRLRARFDALLLTSPPAPIPPSAPSHSDAMDVLRLCEAEGCLELASGFMTTGASIEQVRDQVREAKRAKAAAATRESAITALCRYAGVPQLAPGYVRSAALPEDVRAHLAVITALLDDVQIDGTLMPDQPSASRRRPSRLSTTEIYAARNAGGVQ